MLNPQYLRKLLINKTAYWILVLLESVFYWSLSSYKLITLQKLKEIQLYYLLTRSSTYN